GVAPLEERSIGARLRLRPRQAAPTHKNPRGPSGARRPDEAQPGYQIINLTEASPTRCKPTPNASKEGWPACSVTLIKQSFLPTRFTIETRFAMLRRFKLARGLPVVGLVLAGVIAAGCGSSSSSSSSSTKSSPAVVTSTASPA